MIDYGNLLLNLIFTAAIYSLPIAIYRHVIRKSPVDKPKAKKISIIYGIIAFFVMSILIAVINGSGAAGGSILLWSWVNYRVLISGKAKTESNITLPSSSANLSHDVVNHQEKEKIYCRHCGGVIDVENNVCTYCKKPYYKKQKGGRVSAGSIIIFVLVALNVFQFFSFNATLKERNDYIATLEDKSGKLDREIKEWKNIADSYKIAGNTYEDIENFFSSGKASTYNDFANYYASTNVVIVNKGEVATFNVTSKTYGTVWMEADTRVFIDAEWSKEWKNSTTSVTITGKNVGTSILEFTKDNTADGFYVLVVVI